MNEIIMKKIAIILVCLLFLSNFSYAQRKIEKDSLYRKMMKEIAAQNQCPTLNEECKKMAKAMAVGGISAYTLETVGVAGSATVGFFCIGAAVVLATKSIYEGFVFSGKNRANLYPDIANALYKSPVFSNYKVVLIDAPHTTASSKKALINFLLYPFKEIPIEETTCGRTYRFYFIPHVSQIFADVDVDKKIIFVRQSSINPANKKIINHFIEPQKSKK